MSYLIQQMWLCLLIAVLLGALIGWWIAKLAYQNKLNKLEANWPTQSKLDREPREYSQDPSQSTSKSTRQANTSTVATATTAVAASVAVAAAEPELETKPTSSEVPLDKDQSSYDVEEVEGIGTNYGKKLRELGINTTEQLLGQAYDMEGRIRIAESIGIEDFVILKWASMCDLMRVPGVAGQLSEQLVNARIYSIQDLSQQNATTLQTQLATENRDDVEEIPNESALAIMIKHAKELKTILHDD